MSYEVQITYASGIADKFRVPARAADRMAADASKSFDIIEADVLRNGVFLTAYINGTRCLG